MERQSSKTRNHKMDTYCNTEHNNKGLKTNNLRYVDYIGLGCQTSYNSNPSFFLFADVDTKDKEILRLTLQVFAKHQLSFYYYETDKGWHVVSPCLLNLVEWDRSRSDLSDVLDNYYRNLVIRIEYKKGDSSQLHWDNFNEKQRHKESNQFHSMMRKRFGVCAKSPNRVDSQMFFTHFTQIR